MMIDSLMDGTVTEITRIVARKVPSLTDPLDVTELPSQAFLKVLPGRSSKTSSEVEPVEAMEFSTPTLFDLASGTVIGMLSSFIWILDKLDHIVIPYGHGPVGIYVEIWSLVHPYG
jgi:hypothetical protein